MRIFVGIELDEATRNTCAEAQHRLARAAFEAKVEALTKLHVTLAFLGNVPDERLDEIEAAMDDVARTSPTCEIVWDRVNAFPNTRRPRIIFVGSRDHGSGFRSVVRSVRHSYQTMGFTFDDDAVAHITIARVKGGSRRPLPMIELAPHTMPVTHIALFESLPDKENNTTRYHIRHRTTLSP